MRQFKYKKTSNISEATSWLRRYGGRACVIAGGTDLLGKLKGNCLPKYPEAVINLKNIPGLSYIIEENGALKIGALTKLHDIAVHPLLQDRYAALAMAAQRAASPNIRHMGTIAGNLCQDVRCWYYRSPNNRFPCLRKGGGRCYAIDGDNRYHSIFGGSVEDGCFAVNPGDMAPALVALDAMIRTSNRTVKAEDFFAVTVCGTTILEPDEIVTEIEIPAPRESTKSFFVKFAFRSSIDFPVVNCAVMVESSRGIVASSKVCLNAVYVKPYRALAAEEVIQGKMIDHEIAGAAGELVGSLASPLKHNGYMAQVVKTLIERSILACKQA